MGTHYCHLNLEERRKLAQWLEAKMPISEIADRLGRASSTMYRDIKRNRYTDTEPPLLQTIHVDSEQALPSIRRSPSDTACGYS